MWDVGLGSPDSCGHDQAWWVEPGKRTGADRDTKCCNHTGHGALVRADATAFALGGLCQDHADDQHRERAPLVAAERLCEDHHAEDGGRDCRGQVSRQGRVRVHGGR